MSYQDRYQEGRAAALAKFARESEDALMKDRVKKLHTRRPDLAVKYEVGWKEQLKAPKKLGEG